MRLFHLRRRYKIVAPTATIRTKYNALPNELEVVSPGKGVTGTDGTVCVNST